MKSINLITVLLLSALLNQAQNHQIIIQLQKEVGIEFFNTQASAYKTNGPLASITPIKQLSANLNIWLVETPTPLHNTKQTLTALEKYPQIKIAQLNQALSYRSPQNKPNTHNTQKIPNDPLYNQQWQYNNKGENGGLTDADTDAPQAWQISTGGLTATNNEIVVAVIDGGINLNHPDLVNNLWQNPYEIPNNNLDDDANGYIDDINGWNFNDTIADVGNNGYGHWHGTPVAGIIGAQGNNNQGVCGVNWRVKLMNIAANQRVSDVIAAYDYVLTMRKRYNKSKGTQGAFVVATNTSLGINGGQPANQPLWCIMYNALGEVGILNVAATANNLIDVDIQGDLPTTCTSDYLISVTNTNHRDALDFAAYGQTHIDLSAPGTQVFTTSNNYDYETFGGTSAAAPHVAGTVALLYSFANLSFIKTVRKNPATIASLIKSCILEGTDPALSLTNKTVSGGRLNIYNSFCILKNKYTNNACGESVADAIQLHPIFPNPTRGILQIGFQQQGSSFLKARLFNPAGQVVQQQYFKNINGGMHQLTFYITNLPGGVYYLILNGKSEVRSEKIVIQ